MSNSKDLTKLDLYGLLEVTENATEKEIVSAYRKKALKCHPDKNPDNPNAALEFQQLSSALQILTDIAARTAYDKVWKAKRAAKERHKELDSKRKKLKEDLEARERAYEKKPKEELSEKDLQAEIDRLQKEGSSLLQKEQELLKEQMKKERQDTSNNQRSAEAMPRLKIKWKAAKGDKYNGGYSADILQKIFSAYGEVTALVVSNKRNGSAIVEFPTTTIAQKVLLCERGYEKNPFTLSWIDAAPASTTNRSPVPSKWDNNDEEDDCSFIHKVPSPFKQQTYMFQPMTSQERDYESLVLRKMRQAEERKRLTEEMMKEDQVD